MKTFLITTAVSLSLLSLPSHGQIVNFPILCTDINTLAEVLEKHNEEAAMTMTTFREVGGGILESSTVLFINYETKTWTLAEQITKEKYCVISVGENIKPYLDQK